MVVKSAFYTTIRSALPQAPPDPAPSERPGFLQPRWPTSQIAATVARKVARDVSVAVDGRRRHLLEEGSNGERGGVLVAEQPLAVGEHPLLQRDRVGRASRLVVGGGEGEAGIPEAVTQAMRADLLGAGNPARVRTAPDLAHRVRDARSGARGGRRLHPRLPRPPPLGAQLPNTNRGPQDLGRCRTSTTKKRGLTCQRRRGAVQ